MGGFPCLCLRNPCDKVPWLCVEVCCCTICAVTANRAYIQRTKGVMNDACDDCLIWATCVCQWALCILECLNYPVDPSCENIIDCFYYIVVGCMITQQDIEINADMPGPQPQVMGAVVNPQGNPV